MSIDFDALDHEHFMREALHEAELSLAEGERPIGAVVVHDGQVIGRGRAQHKTRQSEIAHAELNALLQAEQYIYAHSHECVIYTTVEPCVMCLGAIVMSDIDHVVFALPDRWINPARMLEIEYVRRHIKHYVGGVLEAESIALWERADPRELRMMLSGKQPVVAAA
ncbi:MAG: nucleoside deaminase [Chloroflexi bacterium]|nr:nucleoside deaminase [Chloroflexota bacterium]